MRTDPDIGLMTASDYLFILDRAKIAMDVLTVLLYHKTTHQINLEQLSSPNSSLRKFMQES